MRSSRVRDFVGRIDFTSRVATMSTESQVPHPRRISSLAVRVASAVGIAAVVGAVGYYVAIDREAPAQVAPLPPRKPGGALLVCGGGDIGDDVYRRFVHIGEGDEGRLVVIPSYVPTADDAARLIDRWTRRGFRAVEILHASSRAESDDPAFSEPLIGASAVWLGGGDQARLAELYADTEVERRLQALFERGGIIGASGGAAAALSRVMIAADGSPGDDDAAQARGLDILRGAVIDQHLLSRNRLKRLLTVLDAHAGRVGLGVDERTAVLIERGGAEWTVLGRSYAVVCVPAKERGPRIEVLKPGDVTEIAELKERSGVGAITSTADFNRWLSSPNLYEGKE